MMLDDIARNRATGFIRQSMNNLECGAYVMFIVASDIDPDHLREGQEARLSRADLHALPGQFDALDLSIDRRRRRNQYDLIAVEFNAADQVLPHVVLNR